MNGAGWIFGLIVTVIMTVGLGLWGCPQYNVYQAGKAGEAELANADYSKKVAVQTAQAKLDSAKMLADAEIIRATGVAKANEIIGNSLKGNEAYLRYLWIDKLDAEHSQIIYVPTEANMPVMEAGRGLYQPATK